MREVAHGMDAAVQLRWSLLAHIRAGTCAGPDHFRDQPELADGLGKLTWSSAGASLTLRRAPQAKTPQPAAARTAVGKARQTR
jgi:hypothetical protein